MSGHISGETINYYGTHIQIIRQVRPMGWEGDRFTRFITGPTEVYIDGVLQIGMDEEGLLRLMKQLTCPRLDNDKG